MAGVGVVCWRREGHGSVLGRSHDTTRSRYVIPVPRFYYLPAHIHTSHPALFTSFPRLLHPSRQPKQSILFICNTPGECSLIPCQLSSIAAALMDRETTARQCLALNVAVIPQEAGTMVLADHPCWVILSWDGRTSTMHALLTKRDENDAARCRCR